MADNTPPIDAYDVIVARHNGKFRARIAPLGLSAEADSADIAIASVTQLGEELLAAAKSAGIAEMVAPPDAAQPAPHLAAVPGIAAGIVAAVPSDGYGRFFVKSLIAAVVFVCIFGMAGLAGAYVFGSAVANVIANSVSSKLAQLSTPGLASSSTGVFDAVSRVTAYLQLVPPERKVELQNNLRFIASELEPYFQAITEPLVAPPKPGQSANSNPAKPTAR